jgi:putative transposase
MRKGFLYLVAIMDWHTRKVLAWRISNMLEADFCVEALNEAIHECGPPEIMNTDQGSQFTSFVWTDRLKRVGTRISMDGKGRCIDNPRAFLRTNGRDALDMSRLWRSLKYECVYLHAWETGSQARAGIGRRITFYNHHRPHTAHGGQPPAVVYFNRHDPDQQVQAVA